MNKEILGLSVSIYRDGSGYDCTNGGASSKFDKGIVTGYKIGEDSQIFPPSDDCPEYVILRDFVNGGQERIRAVPVELVESGKWTMFGGNFLYTCDSRFPSDQPIKIHDRVEG